MLLQTHNIAPLFSGTDGLTEAQKKRKGELSDRHASFLVSTDPKEKKKLELTDNMKAELDNLLTIDENFNAGIIELPAGAKTYLNKCVKKLIYNYKGPPFRGNRATEKGNEVEQSAIEFMNVQLLKAWVKSEEELTYGDLVKGHPDIVDYDDCEVIDIKCPETKDSFPETVEDAENSDYTWQVRMYILMKGWTKGKIIHVLMSTPEEMVWEGESDDLHYVDDLDPRLRYTIVEVSLEDDVKAHMERRLKAAGKYALDRIEMLKGKNCG